MTRLNSVDYRNYRTLCEKFEKSRFSLKIKNLKNHGIQPIYDRSENVTDLDTIYVS